MTSPIRVLVVDDSVVVRKMLRDSLSQDPIVKVTDVAANGNIALNKIKASMPNLVVLDVDMPGMNGLETLQNIRASWPKLPVILFTGMSDHEAISGMKAMELGANAVIAKPSNLNGRRGAEESIVGQLLPMIKSICVGDVELMRSQRIVQQASKVDSNTQSKSTKRKSAKQQLAILAIGSSTGGPNALADVIGALPGTLPVPVIVTQHMPPNFTRHLAERLNNTSALKVVEGQPGMNLEAGCVYIAPGDYHMCVERSGTDVVIRTNQAPLENSCRPAVDPMLRSVAEVYGSSSLVVILTGMGSDGLKGCEIIHQLGGRIFVQDEETSVVWGMPGFVSRAGLAERDVPLAQISGVISRCFDNHKIANRINSAAPAKPHRSHNEKVALPSMRQALVVDDSRAVRSLLSRIMRELGFDPIQAESGLDALRQIEDGIAPEVALVDWNMPEMNGIELIEALRERNDLDHLKIVMVTSETDVEFVKRALSHGADEYVMKPFSKEDLIARLNQIGIQTN